MFSKSALLTTLLALASTSSVLGADLTIQTPASLIQCQPALLSWTGGQAPYYLAVIPGSQPSAAALQDLGTQNGNSLTWTVNVAAGTSITLKITDSTGVVNYNDAVTIQAGSSSACLNAAASSSAGSASTPAAVSTAPAAAVTSGGASASMSMSMTSASAAASSASAMSSAGASSAAASKASSAAASGASAASSAKSSGASAASAAASAATSAVAKSGASSVSIINGAVVAVAAGVVGLAFA